MWNGCADGRMEMRQRFNREAREEREDFLGERIWEADKRMCG